MVSPAPITHITDLNLDVFLDPGPSLILILFSIKLNLLIISAKKTIELWWRTKPIETIRNCFDSLSSVLLTLSYYGFFVDVDAEILTFLLLLNVSFGLVFSASNL
jgi:hypothetical protein